MMLVLFSAEDEFRFKRANQRRPQESPKKRGFWSFLPVFALRGGSRKILLLPAGRARVRPIFSKCCPGSFISGPPATLGTKQSVFAMKFTVGSASYGIRFFNCCGQRDRLWLASYQQ